jgi:hypothetical protein
MVPAAPGARSATDVGEFTHAGARRVKRTQKQKPRALRRGAFVAVLTFLLNQIRPVKRIRAMTLS